MNESARLKKQEREPGNVVWEAIVRCCARLSSVVRSVVVWGVGIFLYVKWRVWAWTPDYILARVERQEKEWDALRSEYLETLRIAEEKGRIPPEVAAAKRMRMYEETEKIREGLREWKEIAWLDSQ